MCHPFQDYLKSLSPWGPKKWRIFCSRWTQPRDYLIESDWKFLRSAMSVGYVADDFTSHLVFADKSIKSLYRKLHKCKEPVKHCYVERRVTDEDEMGIVFRNFHNTSVMAVQYSASFCDPGSKTDFYDNLYEAVLIGEWMPERQ